MSSMQLRVSRESRSSASFRQHGEDSRATMQPVKISDLWQFMFIYPVIGVGRSQIFGYFGTNFTVPVRVTAYRATQPAEDLSSSARCHHAVASWMGSSKGSGRGCKACGGDGEQEGS